jgi:hypothetical protein
LGIGDEIMTTRFCISDWKDQYGLIDQINKITSKKGIHIYWVDVEEYIGSDDIAVLISNKELTSEEIDKKCRKEFDM